MQVIVESAGGVDAKIANILADPRNERSILKKVYTSMVAG
jgi:hypothetical protein